MSGSDRFISGDDDFLREIQSLSQKNLALEALRRLLNDEIKSRSRKNIVEARSFRELLERAIPAWERAQAEAGKLLGDDGLRLLDAAIGRVKSAHAGA